VLLELYVSPAKFEEVRELARQDELRGIDPGKRWRERYPGATEIAFHVRHVGQRQSTDPKPLI
jgi:hypothetical protein